MDPVELYYSPSLKRRMSFSVVAGHVRTLVGVALLQWLTPLSVLASLALILGLYCAIGLAGIWRTPPGFGAEKLTI